MEAALIVRGKISNSRHIELDEAVPGFDGEVEVVLRRVATPEQATPEQATPEQRDMVDVFALIAASSPGTRSKADIDRQIAEERGSWGDG